MRFFNSVSNYGDNVKVEYVYNQKEKTVICKLHIEMSNDDYGYDVYNIEAVAKTHPDDVYDRYVGERISLERAIAKYEKMVQKEISDYLKRFTLKTESISDNTYNKLLKIQKKKLG